VNSQNSLQSAGDLNFIVRAVIGAVMFALLFSIAAMMMQTIRERNTELAVLRTIGFSDQKVFWLLMTEGTVLCVSAAVIGILVAKRPICLQTSGSVSMPGSVILIGLGIALLLAIVSGTAGQRCLRMQVSEALSGR
jgi:putative ABC transport system permease protein